MSKDRTTYVRGGASPCFLLFIIFLILKLTGVIAWSWWWVTAPLWMPILAVIAVLVTILAFVGTYIGISFIADATTGGKS